MRVRVVVVGLLVAALAGGLIVASRASTAPDQAPAQPAPAPVPVGVVTAKRADLLSTVIATGTVVSLREADVAPAIAGRVASVRVREGQHVAAGTPLMQLDARDLAAQEAQARASVAAARARLAQLLAGARPEERRQAADATAQADAGVQSAQANVVQTKATLDLAQSNVARMRTLHQMGAVSRQDLDSAESQFRQAQAAVMAAESQLRQAQAASNASRQSLRLVELGAREEEIAATRAQLQQAEALLASAQIRRHDATVTAPFAGTVTRRLVEPGESASPAAPAFVIAQLDNVFAELAVPERHRAALRPGQGVDVVVDAIPGRRFAGKISEIRPAATVATRSFAVKVRVPNPEGVLRPGMFARASITTAVRRNALQIPDTAVLLTAGKPIVFVVQDGKAARREVVVEESQNGTVVVESGVNEGDQVITSGAEGLTDNQPVAPRRPQR